jgi:hypothetical protein
MYLYTPSINNKLIIVYDEHKIDYEVNVLVKYAVWKFIEILWSNMNVIYSWVLFKKTSPPLHFLKVLNSLVKYHEIQELLLISIN